MSQVKILTYSSSASAGEECRGQVLISGSYGGEYNAWHAAKWGIRGVVLNDAGVGKDGAGINGLPYLDGIGLPAATADAQTCHIADAEHMLAHGIISHVNETAAALGCAVGQSVRECAERMLPAPVVTTEPPAISGGKRYLISENPGEPKVICLDAAPMLEDADAGAIAVTGSHAAMFRGRPDGLIAPALRAVFFSDAGVGLDGGFGARPDLAVDAELADAPGDELRVLRAEVEDEDALVQTLGDGHRRTPVLGGARPYRPWATGRGTDPRPPRGALVTPATASGAPAGEPWPREHPTRERTTPPEGGVTPDVVRRVDRVDHMMRNRKKVSPMMISSPPNSRRSVMSSPLTRVPLEDLLSSM